LLGVMINSGVPTIQALRSLVHQIENPKMQLICEDMVTRIEEGASFSEAMLDFPDVFEDKDVGMARAGEASGQLSNSLGNLADETQKAYAIKNKVKSAMIYPALVMGLLVVVVIAMMVFVVPRLKDLFNSVGENLPLITRIVVGISDFLVNQKLIVIGVMAILVLGVSAFRKTDAGIAFIDRLLLKLPVIGKLFKESYLARFASTLSNLLNSKLSIVDTLQITANSIGNEMYRRRLLLAKEDIKQGIPLAETLTESYLFPAMLINMIEVGEKTAQLDEMMEKVAAFYEDELDTSVKGLSKILEPLILIFIGITVGGVVAAIMLPVLQLSSLADQL
ncbi:type II secretion system F family protein, partial [Patescibacteria group bacterium]|nr:type II secretion system F family protein [Patescibacteria group bacterium]